MATPVADLYAVLGLRPDEASWKRGNELIGGVKQALAFFAGYQVIKQITSVISATVELGGHLDDLRQKTGLSATSLQEWGYAAKLGGSDMDSFAASTGKFARVLKEASEGSEDANKALRAAGLTSQAVTAALKGGDGLDAALTEVAAKFADMPDGPEKTALAMNVFGKSGAELIPTLNQGAEGLRELREEAEALGVVMGDETVDAADKLGDNIDKLKMSTRGLLNSAVSALLPSLQELVDTTLEWIKANRKEIIEGITKTVYFLVDAVGLLVKGIRIAGDIVAWFSEHANVATAVITGLGIVIAAVALEAAAAWLVAFWPVTLIAAAIAALVVIVLDLWDSFATGKGVFADIGRFIARVFDGIVSTVRAALGGIKDVFVSIGTAISDAYHTVIDWITDKIAWAWDQIKSIGDALTKAGEWIAGTDSSVSVSHINAQSQPVQPSQSKGPSVRVDAGDTNITINAGAASAADVGVVVDEKIKEHHDKVWRDAHAATGGADEVQ